MNPLRGFGGRCGGLELPKDSLDSVVFYNDIRDRLLRKASLDDDAVYEVLQLFVGDDVHVCHSQTVRSSSAFRPNVSSTCRLVLIPLHVHSGKVMAAIVYETDRPAYFQIFNPGKGFSRDQIVQTMSNLQEQLIGLDLKMPEDRVSS